jgi:dinuclear metal center YbgI/SA1388 family protein
MSLLKEVCAFLEDLAPSSLQENYDNSGLLVGDPDSKVTGVLVSLDVTENIVDEAIQEGCNVIVSHHPFIFQGIKKLKKSNWVHRVLTKAIKNDLAIISVHTNLDNVLAGVNGKMASVLGLKNTRVLLPRPGMLMKLAVFVPSEHLEKVQDALFQAGAGSIGNYDECSFQSPGIGSFRAKAGANPFVGKINELQFEPESRLEVVFPAFLKERVVSSMKNAHPYEEVAYDLYKLENSVDQIGSGLLGDLEEEIEAEPFFRLLMEKFNLKGFKHSPNPGHKIKRVALCGGAGVFLLEKAIQSGADVFVTADVKYHDFFEAIGKVLLVDIGHFESEQFTIDLLSEQILQKFPTFAVRKTKISTNPVNYYP